MRFLIGTVAEKLLQDPGRDAKKAIATAPCGRATIFRAQSVARRSHFRAKRGREVSGAGELRTGAAAC
jgi:hypothetical protein